MRHGSLRLRRRRHRIPNSRSLDSISHDGSIAAARKSAAVCRCGRIVAHSTVASAKAYQGTDYDWSLAARFAHEMV